MDPKNRRPHSMTLPVKQRKQGAPDFKPVVAHVKTAPSAQSVKHISARPINSPQTKLNSVQAKMAGPSLQEKHPVAPPVYKPQPGPRVLQRKKSANQPPSVVAHSKHQPVAPSVYRPQRVSQGVQRKASGNRQVIQRAAVHSAAWHCQICNENCDYGFKRAAPEGPCANGHTNWVPGLVLAAAEPVAAAAVPAVPPRAHELKNVFKGAALVANQQALVEKYCPGGKSKKHGAHGASAGKQFSMKDELANFLKTIGDAAAHEAARKAINADFGTSF